LELITSVWKVEGCIEAKENLLYRFSAADQSTGGSDQSTDGHPGALCRFCAQDQSTDMPVSRLIIFPRVQQSTDMPVSRLVLSRSLNQSTGGLDQSTDRLGQVLERVF